MAILKSAARKKLPNSEFAGPGRSYPIPDANHGRAALSMLHNAPPAEQQTIKAKVKRKFPGIK
jgi:hypothetical protein